MNIFKQPCRAVISLGAVVRLTTSSHHLHSAWTFNSCNGKERRLAIREGLVSLHTTIMAMTLHSAFK